ncbi:hypothetical protein SRO_6833 [Streptomyces rochei]|nr:hypothetical protein SRO_6833 [Streptomyces rochei]
MGDPPLEAQYRPRAQTPPGQARASLTVWGAGPGAPVRPPPPVPRARRPLGQFRGRRGVQDLYDGGGVPQRGVLAGVRAPCP